MYLKAEACLNRNISYLFLKIFNLLEFFVSVLHFVLTFCNCKVYFEKHDYIYMHCHYSSGISPLNRPPVSWCGPE